jgi:hypothetical protein
MSAAGRHFRRSPESVMDGLSSNQEFEIATVALVLALGGAAWWAIRKRTIAPVLVANAGLAAAALIYNIPSLKYAVAGGDEIVLGFLAFELATLILSAAALWGLRIPKFANAAAFAINFILSAGFLFLAFTFRITRLI